MAVLKSSVLATEGFSQELCQKHKPYWISNQFGFANGAAPYIPKDFALLTNIIE